MLAVTKARQLMAEHNISMAEIEQAKGGNIADAIRDRIKDQIIYTRKGTKLADYDWHVAFAVGHLTDCKVFQRTNWNPRTISVAFMGDEEDIALAGELFHIWLQAVRKMARQLYGSGNVWDVRHTSYAVGLASRLQERAREAVQGLSSTQEQTWGLVVATKKQAIQEAWNKMFPPPPPMTEEQKKALAELRKIVKPRKVRAPKRDWDAYDAGYTDGASFNMNTKVIK